MTLIRYCWESTCELGNDFIRCHMMVRFTRRFISCHVMVGSTRRFISCHVMAGSTWRFISCHVMAGCNHRFISCHGVVRLGLPTVYDGYMVWYAIDFLNMV